VAIYCAADRVVGIRLLRSVWRTGIAALAGILLASCGSHAKSITVDREIFIPGVKPRVDAIARTHDGGFVVTGTGVAAWVVATDKQGSLLWRYNDPIDEGNHTGSQSVPQSEFHGALPLANGNTLLCGGKGKGGGTDNLVVILDHNGRLVERRVEVPNGDSRYIYSNFYQCFPWQDGILLLGNTNDGTHGYVWLVELDGNGVKRRQALLDNVPAVEAGAVVGPSFVFTAWDSEDSFRVIRANEKGETIAKRVIAGEFIVQLRSVVETNKTSILIYRAGKATLYTLDERLQDVQPRKEIQGSFDPQAARGYVLADGSIVLFGRRSNAAISLIGAHGKPLAIREFNPKYTSFSVSDAVPISTDEFVTVRGSVSEDPTYQGLVMSWVTIKESK
jgi:hypothetical protein